MELTVINIYILQTDPKHISPSLATYKIFSVGVFYLIISILELNIAFCICYTGVYNIRFLACVNDSTEKYNKGSVVLKYYSAE